MSIETSAAIKHHIFTGIQLLPNSINPYVQTTSVSGGIELEDWTAHILRVCGNDPIVQGSSNLLLYSNTISDIAWNKSQLNIASDKLSATNVNSVHWIYQAITKAATVKNYTGSVYVKANEYSRVYLRVSDGVGGAVITHFNLNTQTFTNTSVLNSWINLGLSFTDEGSGWYRISVNATSSNDTSITLAVGVVNDSDDYSFIGDNVKGIHIKNLQLQEGDLTDYVSTTSSSVNNPDETGINITAYFNVDRIFNDTNGQAQFDWSLTNIPNDFGNDLVYLKVTQLIGETFYSSPFQLTDYESEKTCRLDYRANDSDTMQSVQVQMYYWQKLKSTEINSYYQVSTRNTVTTLVKSQKYQRWITEFISNDLMIKIDDAFENKFVYVNLIRANLFEANEIKEFEAEENFKENILKLAFIESDVYDPLYVAPIASLPSIVLNSVVANGLDAIYDFSYSNFTPTYFTFQTSQDQTTWSSKNLGITSSQSVEFNGTGTWYFRIIHPEATSNIIQLDLGSSVVAVDDKANVEKGGVIDISVLFNDSLVGTTTITSVTAPTNGTASIIDNGTKIRYTHNDSSTTFDSFSYTISNGITSDTATVDLVITSSDIGVAFPISGGRSTSSQACPLSIVNLKWHNGSGSLPVINDFVFDNEALTTPYDGNDFYYATHGGKYIKIDEFGKVTSIGYC